MLNQRFLGGETGRRTLLGRTGNKTRRTGLIVIAVAAMVVSLFFSQIGGPIIGAIVAGFWVLGTKETPSGSPIERVLARRAWRQRSRIGYDAFRPVQDRPAGLDEAMMTGTRRERAEVRREWSSFRDWPEGASEMRWLYARPGLPGIAWHTPRGETPWLSVVFPLRGQVSGLQGDAVVNDRSELFGQMLTRMAGASSLQRRVQMVTRVQPVDTARHEAWVADKADLGAPQELLRSYVDVVDRIGRGALMQRHYAVGCWPLNGQFSAEAARKGPGQEGWIRLMGKEIDRMWRALAAAGLQPGRALSAAEVGAVLRHQQLPSWPLDQAGDIDVDRMWFPMDESWSYVAVTGADPTGDQETWYHRTAEVDLAQVDTTARDPLWMMPLLSQMRDQVVRTVSVQIEGVSQRVALREARDDLTSDLADEQAQRRRGALVDDDLEAGVAASRARRNDLRPGQNAAGARWAMHITVSARDVDALSTACSQISEQADGAGLSWLRWLDPMQAAGQAATWPLGRGFRTTEGSKLTALLSGKGHEDAL